MQNQHNELIELGWSEWFEQRAKCESTDAIARVAAVDRELLLLMDHTGVFRAKLTGSYMHRHHQSHHLPCVGDWVCAEKQPGDGIAMIHNLIERRTLLRRKSPGDVIDYQMIASNVDYAVIVQSCQFDFNLKRLERYLVMVTDGGALPFILLTKTDLVEPSIAEHHLDEIRGAGIFAQVALLSNVTQEGVDDFKKLLIPGKTYCFVGSSGVGKSTLINHLIGREMQVTKSVSGTGEGRHTTVRRELIRLENGALVIDNPGMREFGIMSSEGGITNSYVDIASYAPHCRYRDCRHTNEPGCAVLAAVESGEISRAHYDNYLKIKKESEFYQMSYVEKRKKEKDFGKFIKSAKKDFRK